MQQERITIEHGKKGGNACIRGLRIMVNDIIGYLESGMTETEILEELPMLESEDIMAAKMHYNSNNKNDKWYIDLGTFLVFLKIILNVLSINQNRD